MALNRQLLLQFMNTFYGYGDQNAPYWFIGIEEKGGYNEPEIDGRIRTWEKLGKHELEDVKLFHDTVGMVGLFGPGARLQPTWGRLIRVVLTLGSRLKDQPIDQVLDYQKNELARTGNETALLEILPLPTPAATDADWPPYDTWAQDPDLATRKSYITEYAPRRAEHLEAMIGQHRPRLVVLYGGVKYRDGDWREAIANVSLTTPKGALPGIRIGCDLDTVFVLCYSPAARAGNMDQYFDRVAAEASKALAAHQGGQGLTRQEAVRGMVKRLVHASPQLIFDVPAYDWPSPGKDYLRVAYPTWDNAVDPKKGESKWTPSNRMLLFTFDSYPDTLRLNLMVGPGQAHLRKALLDKANKGGLTIYPEHTDPKRGTWTPVYETTVLWPADYQPSVPLTTIESKLDTFWNTFLATDFRKIVKAFK